MMLPPEIAKFDEATDVSAARVAPPVSDPHLMDVPREPPHTFAVFENRIGRWQWRLFGPDGRVMTDSFATFVSPASAAAAGLTQKAKRGLAALEPRATRY